jgi:hypothetical protein
MIVPCPVCRHIQCNCQFSPRQSRCFACGELACKCSFKQIPGGFMNQFLPPTLKNATDQQLFDELISRNLVSKENLEALTKAHSINKIQLEIEELKKKLEGLTNGC